MSVTLGHVEENLPTLKASNRYDAILFDAFSVGNLFWNSFLGLRSLRSLNPRLCCWSPSAIRTKTFRQKKSRASPTLNHQFNFPAKLFLLSAKKLQKLLHRIIVLINHTLFQRNDRIIRNRYIFRTNLRAAFRDVTKPDSVCFF